MQRESSGIRGSALRSLILVSVFASIVFGVWYLSMTGRGQSDFTLTDLDGNVFSLSDFEGRVVLIDFMATWCGPCQISMPMLLSLHEELGDQVEFISISVTPITDTDSVLDSWRRNWGANWTHARDLANPPVGRRYNVTSIPTFFLIDKEGVQRFHHPRLIPEDQLRQELLSLVNEEEDG